uniref:non-specific serine/threonine protein kinase n=1 Tax=Nonomuraea gerenzanensis TaxID=93944 RepID=A0A1M4E7C9_9ACTN|nr:serine/threonine protein kinase [Nonomuraea gerenzanensis]
MMSDRKQDGRRIAGRYQLQEPIGRGGMGIVWRAYDELLDRTVAVKEVRYAAALGEEVQLLNRRTMREARAAARFEHPNVIVVHDVIEEDDRPWIVMQLVPSRSLGAVIKQDGPLPPKRVAEIGLAVLDALHRAHEAGVLHRDVKPENVLLADDGRVVLTDFGIATLETETQLTVTGLAGTPAFIAPERLKGLPARRESDLWSLGATLYTAVEGRSPHERGMALATMHAVLTDEPDPATHAGPLTDVINGLLVKEPVQRLTYEETQRMLRRALRHMIAAEPDTGSTGPSVAPPTKMFPAAQELHVPAPAEPKRPAVPSAAPPPARRAAGQAEAAGPRQGQAPVRAGRGRHPDRPEPPGRLRPGGHAGDRRAHHADADRGSAAAARRVHHGRGQEARPAEPAHDRHRGGRGGPAGGRRGRLPRPELGPRRRDRAARRRPRGGRHDEPDPGRAEHVRLPALGLRLAVGLALGLPDDGVAERLTHLRAGEDRGGREGSAAVRVEVLHGQEARLQDRPAQGVGRVGPQQQGRGVQGPRRRVQRARARRGDAQAGQGPAEGLEEAGAQPQGPLRRLQEDRHREGRLPRSRRRLGLLLAHQHR